MSHYNNNLIDANSNNEANQYIDHSKSYDYKTVEINSKDDPSCTHKKFNSMKSECVQKNLSKHNKKNRKSLIGKPTLPKNKNNLNSNQTESNKNELKTSLNLISLNGSSSSLTNVNSRDVNDNDILIFNNDALSPTIDSLLMGENFTLTIIGNFINRSFKDDLRQVKLLVEQAYNKIRNGYVYFNSNDMPLETIYPLLLDTLKDEVQVMASVLRSIPEFAKLDYNDLSCIIKNKFLVYIILKYHKLKINNESYDLFKNGQQCTRAIMDRMGNIQMNNTSFEISNILNELNLNEKEFTALMTFILSFPSDMNLKDLTKLIEFNQLVGKILANEVFISKRNKEFVSKMRQVCFLSC